MVAVNHMIRYPFVMANLVRVYCNMTGSAVTGPSVATFYVNEAITGFVSVLGDFWQGLQSVMPSSLTVTIPGSGDLVDEATGALTGTWSDGAQEQVTMTGTGEFANGVGARIRWATAGVHNGRRVRGSTFVVPLIVSQFESSNGLKSATVTTMNNAAATLRGGLQENQLIWSRPVNGGGGQAHPVTAHDIPDKVSWLRSRRT